MGPTAAGQPSLTTNLIFYVVIGALIIFRYSRPMKMSVTRLLVAPVLLLAITVLNIYATDMLYPAPWWQIAVAVVAGGILGSPLGLAMAAHRTVRRTEKPHVMYVDASWQAAAIWLGAFIVKAILRGSMAPGPGTTVLGDALLVFGIATLLAQYWAIYKKFRALDEQEREGANSTSSSAGISVSK
jgi:hypothetical protein